MAALLDATVLSNFAAVGRLDLLQLVLEQASVVRQVHDELRRGVSLGFGFLTGIEQQIAAPDARGWLTLIHVAGEAENTLYRALLENLGDGEAASLAVAKERHWVLYTDDRTARAAAVALSVPLSGTLGLLIRLVRTEILSIDGANTLLGQMIVQARYRSPVSDLRDLGLL